MSDEIIDVSAENLGNIQQEQKNEVGLNIPDPTVVDMESEDTRAIIESRREELLETLPEYPKEWQDSEEDSSGFDDEDSPNVNISVKEKEIQKIIKKYKRYMKSNLKEIRRIGD